MNLKNLIKLSSLLLVLITLLSGATFAQTTYYVNTVSGLDGYDGLSATVTGVPGQGPKKTISNAVAAASSGDIISVEASGAYLETPAVTKKLTFKATGGTVNVTDILINNAEASPANVVVFQGPYLFSNSLVLQASNIIGGNYITVGNAASNASITRYFGTSVDAQINYTGKAINFTYNGTGSVATDVMSTGYELAPTASSSVINNLTTAGFAAGAKLQLNESKTINGTLNTASAVLDLNTFILNLVNTNTAHTLGGDVINGTVNIVTADGAANTAAIVGPFNLPNVTVVGGHATANTVIIGNVGTVGNITVSGTNQNVIVAGPTTVGNVANGSTGDATHGTLSLGTPTTVGSVSNTGTGAIIIGAATTLGAVTNSASQVLSAAGAPAGMTGVISIGSAANITGNVTLSSNGQILFTGGPIAITGNVLNNASLTATYSVTASATWQNLGVISFAGAVTVTGEVKNQAAFSGSVAIASAAADAALIQNNGEIRFAGALNGLAISGAITNASTASALSLARSGAGNPTVTFQNNGRITFAATAAAAALPAIVNSTSYLNIATAGGITYANNGGIIFSANANPVTVASVTNSSSSEVASNGIIDFGAGAGNVVVTGDVISSGAKGGDILFPNASFSVKNLYNQRTEAGADIVIGAAGVAGATVSVTGELVNSGKSNITFNTSVDGAVSVAGKFENSGAGTIAFPNLTTGSIGMNTSFTVSAGTVNLAGAAATGAITAKNINLTNGTIALGAGVRNLTANGTGVILGGATTSPTFTGGANTTLVLSTPVPTNYQTFSIGAIGVVFPGLLDINNASGLVDAVTINGGNLRVLGNVSFTAGSVVINGTNQRLFIGSEVAPTGTGNFTNVAGYRTDNNAFISINGIGAALVGGAGSFGNFEVDMAAGATINATGAFTSVFNLTKGTVTVTSVIFNNAASYPTIVRNAGNFNVAPTFTSMVNIYYIGVDKTTGFELPAAADKLNNLTVATTNGAVTGKGTVQTTVSTTVNGTLTINANQALLLIGADITAKGPAVVVNGDLCSVGGGDELILARATGTAVTGSGWLPAVRVSAASLGNTINGPKGLVTGLLGANNVRGTDDFDPTTAAANADINFANGNASLSVTFGAGALNGSNVRDINTLNAGNVLTVAGNMVQVGNVNLNPAGTVTVPEGIVWTYRGTAPVITGGAAPSVINGAGKLVFLQSTGAAVNVNLTVGAGAGKIAISNLEINLGAAGDAFTVGTSPLTLSGAVTVTRGTLTMNQNVTMTGSALTLTANGAIAGAGILNLNAATEPLTFTYTGTPSISNLTVSKGVVLAGTGTSLTVGTAFVHAGGELNFADRTLTINGTYTRTGGTYAATSGYLVIAGSSFVKGATNFTIPNLRIASAGPFATAGSGVVTVLKNFDLANVGVFTHTIGTTPTLAIDAAANVKYVSGNLDKQPVYNGTISLELANTVALTVPAEIWVDNDALVTTLKVNNSAAATLPGTRKVNTALALTAGSVDVPADKALNLADNTAITVVTGHVTLTGTGALNHGANEAVTYNLVPAGYAAGIEIPANVASLTVARNGNVANGVLAFAKAVTVNGPLSISNDFTDAPTTLVKVTGDVTFANASNAAATPSVITFASSSLTFTGNNQKFNLGGNRVLAMMELAQTGTTPQVSLLGGNLTMSGNITFTNGILVTNENTVILPTVVQGFTRNVTGANVSHIFGTVQKNLAAGATGRIEYPVGSATKYRPVAITFLPANPAITATNIKVTASDVNPGGKEGFPLTIAGVQVDTTANFAWNITSSVSLGPSQTFDLEFEGAGFNNYSNVADVRVISRLGNILDNPWVPQGGAYGNFETGVTPNVTPVVRLTGSTGNLVSQSATFTFGFKKPVVTSFNVTGTVKYDNAAGSVMPGVTVTLTPATGTAKTTTTNAQGQYTFANVANGSYTVSASSNAAWLKSTSLDALTVANHYSGKKVITDALVLKAADVNNSNTVNNTDALLILKRAANSSVVFAKGDWVFSNAPVTVNGASVTADLQGLATGDADTRGMGALAKASVTVNNDSKIQLSKANTISLPVKAAAAMNVGAMTLTFKYPAELVSFENVASKAENIQVSDDQNGNIVVAWADLSGKDGMDLKAGDALLTLQFKSKEELKAGTAVNVELNGSVSEIANKNGEVYNASLNVASLEIAKPTVFALNNNYPNPFNPTTTISYDLPVNGQVSLVVFNTLGEQVATLVNGAQEVGTYKVNFNASNLTSGVYFYRLTVSAGEQNFTQTHKMLLMK